MFDSIEAALDDFRVGRFVIIMDDETRENEGDLVLAAQYMTPEKMAFMVRYTSGLVCVPLTAERLDLLDIPMMVACNTDKMKTAYTVTVDFNETSTGISARDRALTVRMLVDPSVTDPQLFNRPGHVLPLKAREGGVLVRQGHTEAAIDADMCKLSGLHLGAAICELVKEDGSMSRRDDCLIFSKEYNIRIITIHSLIEYIQSKNEK
ncbi:unnamed protein product [Pneumocystis jirovecii]|uniref:3,4-dihydroxy-2-butanone 4-phosphate synthase n=2 Tax=Pneumocystis jirovecii TaxID=42068 RepID=L0PBV3_PNEJI|nr:3,4-dihydroxy-2-butanone-4-phosphate synthase [Pneumocystis jirovecii RU7]KTW28279.1 3,4-dihydroxy-2-butanone-4-phosphate synthase [Pneumocystis jirovecii RU7]CCJ29707.1 unnamed protein product [Pneumocystis jirovecii]